VNRRQPQGPPRPSFRPPSSIVNRGFQRDPADGYVLNEDPLHRGPSTVVEGYR